MSSQPRIEPSAMRPRPAAATPVPLPGPHEPRESGIDTSPARIPPLRLFQHVDRMAVLALVEAAAVAAALYAAVLLRYPDSSLALVQARVGPLWPRAFLVVGVTYLCLVSMGLYYLRQRADFASVLARLLVAGALAQAVLWPLFEAVASLYLAHGVLFFAGVFAIPALAAIRFAFLRLVDEDVFKRRVVVWGCGAGAASIEQRLRRRSDRRGFLILGYVQAPGEDPAVAADALLQPQHELMRRLVAERVEQVVVAMEDRRREFPEAFLRECRRQGIGVCDLVSFLEQESGRVSVELARPSWLIFSDGFRSGIVLRAGKRAFDIGLSLLVLVLASPVALATAIAIFLEDRGPVLYSQVRTGQYGRPFRMFKFRSMSVDAEATGAPVWAVKDDRRVTRVGAFIRKVRIDELPQAVNVLLGQMSFVGPRPERPSFVESLTRSIPFYSERHLVKPGITGWAQVRFPYGASEEDAREKLGYDLYYVKNCSVLLDLIVLLRTVEIVLFRVGSR
ncbi:MAG TPA: TIGR03013 family XrtA/PEP-CTERM system glycosyltransferase [Usitatibacter sp.]|nr:TIGR03013 family XrtA/PEP-CTERM system glycosyltransferase [Usitatibacter sp.]